MWHEKELDLAAETNEPSCRRRKANAFAAHNVEYNGTFKSNDFPFNLTFEDLGVGCNFQEMGKHKVCAQICKNRSIWREREAKILNAQLLAS